jgi:alpha-beta hydrolase superfamily lysophospholipase
VKKWVKKIVIIGLGFWGGIGIFISHALTKRKFYDGIENEKHIQPIPPDFHKIFLRSDEEICAVWLPREGSNKVVIIVHGLRSHKLDERIKLPQIIRFLHGLGFSVLSIDLRAHGESSGERVFGGFKEKDDVLAAINFVVSKINNPRIILWGFSMGGAASILAYKETSYKNFIVALILDSTYSNLERILSLYIKENLNLLLKIFKPIYEIYVRLHGFRIVRLAGVIKEIDCPILILHGRFDELVPIDEANEIYKNCKKRKLVVFNTGHLPLKYVSFEEYMGQIVKFLSTVKII